ncbi:MAG: hypothetical protein ACFFD2_06250 [Promethearchaeota archaeon]
MKKKEKNELEDEDEFYADSNLMLEGKSEKQDKKEKKKEEEEKEKKEKKLDKLTKRRILVNFWRTSLHGEKIGIRQKDQQRAKSRHFSKDMEIFGEVRFEDKKAGVIGFRTKEWMGFNLENGKLPRLVIRYFNENGNWEGSIEQDTIQGLMLSTAYKEDIPIFRIFISGNRHIFTMQKLEKSAGSDEVILPIILEKAGKKMVCVAFDRRRLTMGTDWRVFLLSDHDRTIADLDSKKLDIGGKTYINIYDPTLIENKTFVNSLILFTALIKFWDQVKKSLKEAYKKYRKNEFEFKPSHNEIELLENPRGYRT